MITAIFAVLIFAVFAPSLLNDYVNYDDPLYVTGNEFVKAGLTLKGARWAFTSFHSYNWHPLTWLSHMLDVQLFGLNPLGHHLTSLLLHVANSLLLFVVLRKMTGATWRSLCVAALFALHPLHVESVAWVAERKDVLSTFFWMLAIWAYAGYVKRPRPASYLAVLLFFALGLMAKPMLVTLPFLLLLLDYWPLGRFRPHLADGESRAGNPDWRRLPALLLEKAPLLALTVASCIVTYLAQEKGGALSHAGSFGDNAGNALITYLRYLLKMAWPADLAVFYPLDPAGMPVWQAAGAALILLAASLMVLRRAGRSPYLATGWFWYLGTLVPVIGFVGIGVHAMADRYTYVPLIGIFVMLAWGFGEIAAKWRLQKVALVLVAVAVFVPLSALTWLQVQHWRDSITLFSHALEVTENNGVAHKNLATALAVQGNLQQSLYHVAASLSIRPDPDLYVSQGWLYAQLGQYEESIESCRKALAMAPDNERAHFILGMDHVVRKDYHAAMAEYDELRRIGSGFAAPLLESMRAAGIPLPAAGENR